MQQQNETLAKYYSKKKKLKKRRKIAFYTLLVVLLISVITVLSLTVFFNISKINVNGNSHYTSQKIIEASGLSVGQNLFRLNKFKIIESMKKELPYLDTVEIDRKLPVSININVTESQNFMCVSSGTGICLVDKNLKILNRVAIAPEGLATVYGIKPTQNEVGQKLVCEEGKETTLLELSNALYDSFGAGNITSIDLTQVYDIKVRYQDRVDIKFGTLEGISEKVRLVEHVLSENSDSEHAEIDVSSGKLAYYKAVD